MRYTKQFLTQSDCYRAAAPLSPSGIVVHSTGVDQKRIGAYTSQWDQPGVRACVHGFLGLDAAGGLCYTQTLPYGLRCWGCGAGPEGSFNDSHIQFEICETLDDGDWCRTTYAAALEVCARLCAEFSIDPAAVVTHSEAHALGFASNHGDVTHWWSRFGLGMDGFRGALKKLLEDDRMQNNEENYQVFRDFMRRYEAEQRALPVSDWAAESCARGVKKGLFADGDGDGGMDWPQAYVKRQELAVVLDRQGVLE